MLRRPIHWQQQHSYGAKLPLFFRKPFTTQSAHDECRPLPSSDRHLQSLCKSGLLERAVDDLLCVHTPISDATYLCLLKACIKHRLATYVKRVHAHIALHRAPVTGFLGGYLVIALARCGDPEDAAQVSVTLPSRTVFSWTAIISVYIERGSWHQALRVYSQMEADGVEPDSHTFVSLFKACGGLSYLAAGKKFHADAAKKGFVSVTFVGNTIVSMYGKCSAVLEAQDAFRALPEPDVVSWNSMLSVLVEQGHAERALLLYRQMQEHNAGPEELTFVITLQACGLLAEKESAPFTFSKNVKVIALDIGQAVHIDADRSGHALDVLVGTTLVSMYNKCGTLAKAESVLRSMRQHNAVLWTAMISAYVEHGHAERALHLYRQMQIEGLNPNQLTVLFALQACGILAEKGYGTNGLSMNMIALELGRGLHIDARRDNFLEEPTISSTLLSLYGKCGALEEAEGFFDTINVRNVMSWTAMLSAYVEQGKSMKALQLYKDLKKEFVIVDVVILLYVLRACNEAGSLSICEGLHFDIVSAGHDSVPSVAATLIHAYGGCASIADCYAVFNRIYNSNIVLWNACCAGYAGDGSDLTSLQTFERLKLAGLEPDGVTFSALLSTCSYIGNLSLGFESFISMIQDRGIRPDLRHYGSMVDLFARAGNFHGVENMFERMPVEADYALWFCLLSACRIHGNVELAKRAFDQAVNIMPKCASPYIMLSNIYAEAGLHGRAAEVENVRQIEGAWDFCAEVE